MKKTFISFSGYQKFVTCPRMFKFHYFDKLRPTIQPSHLIFGSAVDAALNALLTESGSPLEACDEVLKQLVLGNVEFNKNDYDGELIDEKTRTVLLEKCRALGYSGDDVDLLVHSLFSKSHADLSDKQRGALALACAASLRAKAILFIEAYQTRVVPLLRKTESVQETITWEDSHGNSFAGVLDLVGNMVGEGMLVIDNKTASRPYEPDAVRVSPQLAIYCKVKGIDRAAFIVLDKSIRKNRVKTCSVCGNDGTGKRHKTCDAELPKDGSRALVRCDGAWAETIKPEVNVQIIVDTVPERVQDMAVEALSDAACAIKAGHFPRNLNACANQYGKPCPYKRHCWQGDRSGLEVKTNE